MGEGTRLSTLSFSSGMKKDLHEQLLNLMTGYFRLVWSENADCYKYRDADLGDIYLEPYEYEWLDIGQPVPVPGDLVDQVLVFGDGTIEFHLADAKESLNWGEFEEEVILAVIRELKLIKG